ncbi:MAG TPA: TrmB family transcriptional regulator [Candidatus Thorarchaeota archaeon]|nr:TrmB family transcriptional regulator [Candidatus Thorarchaeota archaeon]
MPMLTVSETALKALRELGLTEYETAAYLALVQGGQMAASAVSQKSQVPYSRNYDVLGRLEEKGFIQIQRGRPTMYVAKAPVEVVKLVRLSWEERIERSSRIVVDELQPLYERETKVTARDVFVIHGRAAILAKAIAMIESAREEIKLSLPSLDMGVEELDAIIEKILDVHASHVYILTSKVDESLVPLIPERYEVRTRDRVFGAGLVCDTRETLIMLTATGQAQFLGVYSNHVVFASMGGAYFDSLWTDSVPLR